MNKTQGLVNWLKTIFHSHLFKHFITYSTSSFLCRGLTFLMAPLTIVFLAPSEFGLLALTNSFIVIMTIVIGCGMRQALSLEYFHCNSQERNNLIGRLIIIYLFIGLPCIGLLLLNQASINRYFFCNLGSTLLISISLATCFFTFLIEFYQQLLQYRTQISLAIKLQLAAAVCSFLLTFFFLLFLQWGVVGIITAQLFGMIFIYGKPFFCHSIYNKPSLQRVIDSLKKAPRYLKIGFPFVPGMLCNWIMASGDRWFLVNYSSLYNVGIYTTADAFGSLFHIIVSNSIIAIYLPHLLNNFSQHKNKLWILEANNKKIMWASMAGALVVVTCGYLLIKPILFWILPISYRNAIPYIWFTFISYILLMGTYFASIFIQFHKKSYFLATSLIFPALINIILNRLLIPHFAIYGCISATIVAYLLYFLITLAYNYKLQAQYIPSQRVIKGSQRIINLRTSYEDPQKEKVL